MEEKVKQLSERLHRWEGFFADPLWYEKVMPELVEVWKEPLTLEEKDVLREMLYAFFEERLYAGQIAIAKTGPNFDQWRKPVDTVVIHHTGNRNQGISWRRLSTIGFLRQYALDYFRSDNVYGIATKGTPIWSNHSREINGAKVPVFFAYHWVVRKGGVYERLLEDSEIGWQAGNKEVNFSGVGIVLDGDYRGGVPPQDMIEGIKEIIRVYYPHVVKEKIVGHREVNPQSECPGNYFLEVWKKEVVGG